MRLIDADRLVTYLHSLQTKHDVNGFEYKKKFIAFHDVYVLIEKMIEEAQDGVD